MDKTGVTSYSLYLSFPIGTRKYIQCHLLAEYQYFPNYKTSLLLRTAEILN